jgi:RNA polymerase sigma-70 factor (ECF subfamily)
MNEEKRLKKTKEEGDFKAVEELCAKTWEPLYRYVYFRVQNREEAEDITQEAYLKAIDYLRRSNMPIKSDLAFLKTVSLNILRDKWRKAKRQGTLLNIDDIKLQETEGTDSTLLKEQREIILNALKRLVNDQRQVIELRIIKGYSVAETGKIMKRTPGAVRILQYRALKTLNVIIKKSFEQEDL